MRSETNENPAPSEKGFSLECAALSARLSLPVHDLQSQSGDKAPHSKELPLSRGLLKREKAKQ